jgi:broad-specificity NMP kinase
MPAYLIAGIAGSGKSTIIEELSKRGYAAHNTDDMPEVTRLEWLATGEPAEWPEGSTDFSVYGWNWQEEGLRALLDDKKPVFIGASVSNAPKFYHLFDKIFVLTIDEDTLKKRLLTRTTNNFGKHPEDLARVLGIREEIEQELRATGAIPVDTTLPLTEVTDNILGRIT